MRSEPRIQRNKVLAVRMIATALNRINQTNETNLFRVADVMLFMLLLMLTLTVFRFLQSIAPVCE